MCILRLVIPSRKVGGVYAHRFGFIHRESVQREEGYIERPDIQNCGGMCPDIDILEG